MIERLILIVVALCLGASSALADVKILYPTDPRIELHFTEHGGALSSATLLDPRFTRDARPAMEGVPARQIDAGAIDLVTTWSDVFYPFRLLFNHLSVAGSAEIQISTHRDATLEGTVVTPIVPTGDARPQEPTLTGDLVRVTAPANVAGEYRVSGVTGTGAITLASASVHGRAGRKQAQQGDKGGRLF